MSFSLRYYDEDGNLIDPMKVPTPELCYTCAKFHIPSEKDLCMLNRYDQLHKATFVCYAFKELEPILEAENS